MENVIIFFISFCTSRPKDKRTKNTSIIINLFYEHLIVSETKLHNRGCGSSWHPKDKRTKIYLL